MGKIKVLHIIKSLGRGGAEMLLPETIALHDKEAFEFHVIYFLPWKNQLVQSIQQAGGVVTCFPAYNNIRILLQARKVVRYVRAHEIDVIHCHLPWAGFLGRIVYQMTGVPVLYTEHNKQERYHSITKLLNRFSFNFQTAAIAVSEEVAGSIQKNIHPTIDVKTILNGVNVQRFQQNHDARLRIRKELGVEENDILIGTIAVFRFQKRLDVWLEVFERLKAEGGRQKAEGGKLKGVLVGDGPLMADVKAKVRALGLEEDVLLPGLQTNTVAWLSAMDIYMMSSVFEGLPIALLEAMSCGLPVVCTNAGGTGEVIRDGVDGYLVPVEEAMQLREPLAALVKDAGLRQRMGVAARQRVVEGFSLGRMVGELEGLYKLHSGKASC
jgi:L-malate glycosyltransferase